VSVVVESRNRKDLLRALLFSVLEESSIFTAQHFAFFTCLGFL